MLSARNHPWGQGWAGGRRGNDERMTEKRHHPSVIPGPGPGSALTPLAILPTTYHGGMVSGLHRKSPHHASSEPKVLILSWLWGSGDGFGIIYIF